MKILLTGSRGFIGRRVGRLLDERGAPWTAFEGDVLRAEDFEPYQECQAIIHLAAKVRQAVPAEELIRVNVSGTINALGFASAGRRRFILASSYLYGRPAGQPIRESAPLSYHDPYSFSKWLAEQAGVAWSRFFGLSGVMVRIFNVYGPGQPRGFLIPDLVAGLAAGRLKVRDLSSRRDFIFVEDLAELIVRAALTPTPGLEAINAGSGRSHSVAEVIELLFELIGRRLPVENQDRPVAIPDTVADLSRARELLGWSPRTPLREGLASVLAQAGLKPA